MNKKVIGWVVFAGWLLVIGIGIIKAMHDESKKGETEVIEKPVPTEVRGSIISSDDVPQESSLIS